MVGIVVASHSSKLAEGVVEVAKMTAPDVPIIADIGSSILSAEMAIEILKRPKLKMIDCPIVEGAVIAAIESQLNKSLDEIETSAIRARSIRKLA